MKLLISRGIIVKVKNKTVTRKFYVMGRAHASYNSWEKWKR